MLFKSIMGVKDRVKLFCRQSKMTIKDFEGSIKVSNGYVNSISKGIGEDKLSLIIEKYPNLSIEWLLTGTGEMLKQGEGKEELGKEEIKEAGNRDRCPLCEEKERRIEELKEQIQTLKEQLNLLQGIIKGK